MEYSLDTDINQKTKNNMYKLTIIKKILKDNMLNYPKR